jgi:hypothetical protein
VADALLLGDGRLGEGHAEVVGQEDRVVPEAVVAARTVQDRALARTRNVATAPSGAATTTTETKRAPRCSTGACLSRCNRCATRSPSPRPGPPKRADQTPGSAAEGVDLEAAVVGDRHPPELGRANPALSSAFSSYVAPVSGGKLRSPTSPAASRSMPAGPSAAANSRTLPGLPVASTHRWRAAAVTAPPRANAGAPRRARHVEHARDAGDAERDQLDVRLGVDRCALGPAVHLDDAAICGRDHGEVDLGGGVLVVVEVEVRRAADEADRHGGELVAQGPAVERAGEHAPVGVLVQRRVGRQERAQRVPPSARTTSQSTVNVVPGSAARSTVARSARPRKRWISCVRPRTVPRSRGVRSRVARGSMAYSAASHPPRYPRPRRCGGRVGAAETVASTSVDPQTTRAAPSACGCPPTTTERSQRVRASALARHGTLIGSPPGSAPRAADGHPGAPGPAARGARSVLRDRRGSVPRGRSSAGRR